MSRAATIGKTRTAGNLGLVTGVVCVALGAVSAAMASLNVAIPGLVRSTHASQTQLEWITGGDGDAVPADARRARSARGRDGGRDDARHVGDHRGAAVLAAGVGSALNDLSREVGGALGTAVIGSIVTGVYRSSLSLRGVPGPLADQARQSFAVAIHAGGPLGAQAKTAFVNGIHAGLLYAAGAALLAAISVAVLLSPDRRRASSVDADSQDVVTAAVSAPIPL